MGNDRFCHSYAFDLDRTGIQELRRTIRNTTGKPYLLTEHCFLSLLLPAAFRKLDYYTSSWGQEFIKRQQLITSAFTFRNTKGRSNGESAPFFTLSSANASIDFCICTSGNYEVALSFEESGIRLTIGDADTGFSTEIQPGFSYSFPQVLAHVYSSMKECYREKQLYRMEHLLPHPFYEKLPVIYNHWWAYEDIHINEETILKNASIARDIGVEMLVLDAGWFGNDNLTEEWYSVRGDWELVNRERFPRGLKYLKEKLAEMGLTMGIWCEIEGLGKNAGLSRKHPDYAASRDGRELGYLCFGNPAVQEWAYETMSRIFSECGSSYWKLDFNLDPGFGCNCPHHSHGTGDGLVKHYEGLYHVLDRLRENYPDLVIENCSSGGQRLNLEMARHTHIHFLSDPDYSTHQMRIFKEAGKWLLPKQLLHFMWSNTVTTNGSAPFENLNLNELTIDEIRYHMRLAMMHHFGISHRLTDYTRGTLDIIKETLLQYKKMIRPFITGGSYLPVYLSDSMNIFSFSKESEILLFLFAEKAGCVNYDLASVLETGGCYVITDPDKHSDKIICSREEMMQEFHASKDWTSKLLLIRRQQVSIIPG